MNNPEIRKQSEIKWHMRPVVVIMAILFVGPLALPLVWLSPAFRKSHKIVITIIIILLTVWLGIVSIRLYNILLQRITELRELLG